MEATSLSAKATPRWWYREGHVLAREHPRDGVALRGGHDEGLRAVWRGGRVNDEAH